MIRKIIAWAIISLVYIAIFWITPLAYFGSTAEAVLAVHVGFLVIATVALGIGWAVAVIGGRI